MDGLRGGSLTLTLEGTRQWNVNTLKLCSYESETKRNVSVIVILDVSKWNACTSHALEGILYPLSLNTTLGDAIGSTFLHR